ncbi:hypothetical protein ABHI18_006012 [Aspergillus niger]
MPYRDYPFEYWLIPFTRTLSVNWPYEATDCLLSAGDGAKLVINPVFERHFRNPSNRSLGPAFAEAYPSLVGATKIKKFAVILTKYQLSPVGNYDENLRESFSFCTLNCITSFNSDIIQFVVLESLI